MPKVHFGEPRPPDLTREIEAANSARLLAWDAYLVMLAKALLSVLGVDAIFAIAMRSDKFRDRVWEARKCYRAMRARHYQLRAEEARIREIMDAEAAVKDTGTLAVLLGGAPGGTVAWARIVRVVPNPAWQGILAETSFIWDASELGSRPLHDRTVLVTGSLPQNMDELNELRSVLVRESQAYDGAVLDFIQGFLAPDGPFEKKVALYADLRAKFEDWDSRPVDMQEVLWAYGKIKLGNGTSG